MNRGSCIGSAIVGAVHSAMASVAAMWSELRQRAESCRERTTQRAVMDAPAGGSDHSAGTHRSGSISADVAQPASSRSNVMSTRSTECSASTEYRSVNTCESAVPPACSKSNMKEDSSHCSLTGSGSSRMQALEQLSCLADASGSFGHSAKLEVAINVTEAVITGLINEVWGTAGKKPDITIIWTAFVLAHLNRAFAAEKDTWELLAMKSMKCLRDRQEEWETSELADVDALIAIASSRLRA